MRFKESGAGFLRGYWILGLAVFMLMGPNIARAQTGLKVEHDLIIPNARTPWALDAVDHQFQLVPIHHSSIVVNRHVGANLAGSMAASFFYKAKITTELEGLHSRTQLHTKTPVIYLLDENGQDTQNSGDDADTRSYVIVRVKQQKTKRIMDVLSFTQLTGHATRRVDTIDAVTTTTPEGWTRIEPKEALDEGEYCLLPVPHANGTFSSVVYDFGVNPKAPNEADAIASH